MNQQQEYLNIAVFEYAQHGQVLQCKSAAVTSKDDAIYEGLNALKKAEQLGGAPINILAIYSEWKPSEELFSELCRNHPNAKLNWSYEDGDEERFKEDLKRLI